MPTTPPLISSTLPRTTTSTTSTFCTTGRYGARTSKVSIICSTVFTLPSFALDWDRSELVRSSVREVFRCPNTLRYTPANSLSPATPAHTPMTSPVLRALPALDVRKDVEQYREPVLCLPSQISKVLLALFLFALVFLPYVWDSTTFLNARKIGGRSVWLVYIAFVSRSPSSCPNALERSGAWSSTLGGCTSTDPRGSIRLLRCWGSNLVQWRDW